MMPTVHGDEGDRGRMRYTLTDTEHGRAWGVCAEVDGLFAEVPRGTYELFTGVLSILAEGGMSVTLA